ncbi:hypothetical protein GCM10010308_63300 [Streptomyces vinaceusdrappus]|nr:hypothetical protein GCM10010301_63430 [Streptomyces plicatus]GHC36244.1 hypothetical protein GCM10010308_63300 [Streptomyces vinaceusdrappus]
MNRLPGLVSNIKWGVWYDSGRVVLGAPPEAERMACLLHFAEAFGVPVEHPSSGGGSGPARGGSRLPPHRRRAGRPTRGVAVRALIEVVRHPPVCGLSAA